MKMCKPQPTLPSGGLFPLPLEDRCPLLPSPLEGQEALPLQGGPSHFPFPGPGWDVQAGLASHESPANLSFLLQSPGTRALITGQD